MSQPESSLGATPQGKECPEGKIWSEEAGACVDPVEVGTSIEVKGKDFIETTAEIMRELVAGMEKRLEQKIVDVETRLTKKYESKVERGIRKSLGLEEDPVIHLSDLQSYMRKAQLETAASGKRSPASPTQGTGPEGNATLLKSKTQGEITKMFEEYRK
jgi:hypothetical protein